MDLTFWQPQRIGRGEPEDGRRARAVGVERQPHGVFGLGLSLRRRHNPWRQPLPAVASQELTFVTAASVLVPGACNRGSCFTLRASSF